MMEPRRLLDGGGTEIEQLLISAGRSARPSTTSRWKAGVVVALAGLGAGPRLAAAALSRGKGLVAAKWIGVGLGVASTGAVVGTLVASSVHRAAPAPGETPAHAVIRLQAPEYLPAPAVVPQASEQALVDRPIADNGAAVTPPTNTAPQARAAAAPSPTTTTVAKVDTRRRSAVRGSSPAEATVAKPSSNDSALAAAPVKIDKPAAERSAAKESPALSDELRELDRARAAISSGDPKSALGYVDQYARAFPHGMLNQEATVLRIEALHALGDDATARALVDRFVAEHPDSTHARRLRSLVASP